VVFGPHSVLDIKNSVGRGNTAPWYYLEGTSTFNRPRNPPNTGSADPIGPHCTWADTPFIGLAAHSNYPQVGGPKPNHSSAAVTPGWCPATILWVAIMPQGGGGWLTSPDIRSLRESNPGAGGVTQVSQSLGYEPFCGVTDIGASTLIACHIGKWLSCAPRGTVPGIRGVVRHC
jgi:hypothetical protein